MNRILLQKNELNYESCLLFLANDYRAQHLNKILRAQVGDFFEAGILNTKISGQLKIQNIKDDGSIIGYFVGEYNAIEEFRWQHLFIGIGVVRPPVLKRLLKDFASAGVEEIALIQGKLCEQAYNNSHLWNELEHYMILGAEQGRINRLPRLFYGQNKGLRLVEYLKRANQIREQRGVLPQNCIVFGEEEPMRQNSFSMSSKIESNQLDISKETYIMILGAERGWTEDELQVLQSGGFTGCSFGPLTLRTEVAAPSGTRNVFTRNS